MAITALCLQDMQAQTVVHPSIKTKTTFAIVVDQKSYDEAKSEIDAYRTSIEKAELICISMSGSKCSYSSSMPSIFLIDVSILSI